ncbi:MAG TPA: PEP-CTERM sorting domain-containing protein [Candidatus Acidoferrales bacterium]|nr:PEP-CTERM sorting domain-containing protein [Candidatus Acidoferrales bacterium]
MNKAKALYTALGCFVFLFVASAAHAGICPSVGVATDCGVQINVTSQSGGAASAFTVTATGQPPYDNIEDTLVGITNNSSAPIYSITLTSSDSATPPAFLFDGDGACGYGGLSGCGGTTGYEGPNMTFNTSGVDSYGGGTLVINFTGGLAVGANTWFSLEGTPNSLTGGGGIGGNTPEPGSLLLLGTGLLGLALMARRIA